MTKAWSRRAVISGMAGGVLASTARAADAPPPSPGVRVLDPSFEALIDQNAQFETIMEGIRLSEGPVWIGGTDGYLLVSDPPGNVIRRWSVKDGQTEWLRPSGYGGEPSVMFRESGSNGLIAARGGLVMCDLGNRGIARVDLLTKAKTMLCREFEGRRFNSPNDLVLARDGSIYFTDPPYGLTGAADSPWRQMDYSGLFRLAPDDTVTLVDRTVFMPNGIGLSPDGRTLYCTSQGIGWPAFDLDARGRASSKRLFIDTAATGIAGGDGFKIDADGNMWTSSRDGFSVFNPQGKRIGIVVPPGGRGANCAFGADRYLYICAGPRVVRIPCKARRIAL
jgi:gluconolactonase